MKTLVGVLACAAVFTGGTAMAQDDCRNITPGMSWVQKRIIVQPVDEAAFRSDLATRWKTLAGQPLTVREIADTGAFTVDSDVATMELLRSVFRAEGDRFRLVEPDLAIVGHDPTPMVNDEEFVVDDETMWGIRAIHAPEAWQYGQGHCSVAAAIVDSGIHRTHTDLVDNVWSVRKPFVLNGSNFIADCKKDDFGYDAVDGDCRPDAFNPHGTHVSGIVGARGGNGLCVVGVSWVVTLVPVAILNKDNVSCISRAVKGLEFVRMINEKEIAPIRVVNLSWGTSIDSPLIRSQLEQLAKAGVVIVASAGNEECDPNAPAMYPAAYTDISTLISVGATNRKGQITPLTSCGSSILIGAPGENIRTTHPEPVVDSAGGTSMAAAFVTGAVALLASQCRDLTGLALKNLILECADRSTDLAPFFAEGRFLNVLRAAEQCAPGKDQRKLAHRSKQALSR